MKELYYTPEINEFYIGFEYETRHKDEERWYTSEFRLMTDLLSLDMIINGGNSKFEVRVKYLDEKDIESFGFLHSGLDKKIFLYNKKIDFQGFINVVLGIRFCPEEKRNLFVFLKSPDIYSAHIFTGTIKNKSELKTLLKQLGIDGK